MGLSRGARDVNLDLNDVSCMIPRDAFAAILLFSYLCTEYCHMASGFPPFSFFLPNNHMFISLGSIIVICVRLYQPTLVRGSGTKCGK